MNFDSAQIITADPLLVTLSAGVVLLLFEAFAGARRHSRAYLMPITIAALAIAFGLEWGSWGAAASDNAVFGGMLSMDRYSVFFGCVFLLNAALTVMLASSYMREHQFEFGEFYALILFATAGMQMLAAATDLVTVFIGVETMSLAVYVLTGSWRRSQRSSEAAMKYFLVGAFATSILLYGMALVYGAVGSTHFDAIAHAGSAVHSQPLFLVGMLLMVVAFGFKVAAVPFHMWAPDAYEGAPTPVSGFMAAGVKAAGFAVMVRIFDVAFGDQIATFGATGWASVLAILAVLTMTLGNFAALKQDNIKRLLAYSSIAHAGYLLVGLVATANAGPEARSAIMYYLVAYTFTTVGAFGVVVWLGSRGDERLQLDDWAGLGARHPAAALAMTIFMLSLGGVPPTAGFFGKLYVFRAALAQPGLLALVVIAVLNSAVSMYYYLRVITTMYFREPTRETKPLTSPAVIAALAIAAVGTLAIGIVPASVVHAATSALFGG